MHHNFSRKFFIALLLASLLITTISNAAVGDPYIEWVKTFHAGGTADDTASGIAVRATGDVAVAWDQSYAPTAYQAARDIAIDASGNIYITGLAKNAANTNWDYYTVKYDPSGNRVLGWDKRFDGGGDDEASGVAVDVQGNVYVTGRSWNGSNWDLRTIKYASSGNPLDDWNITYDNGNASFPDDAGTSIALDSSGNVYVVLDTTAGANKLVHRIIKYSPAGVVDPVWNKDFGQWFALAAQGHFIFIDASDNVYVTGHDRQGVDHMSIIVKYNSSAARQWVQTFGIGTINDESQAITADSSGNVYVTGYLDNGVNTDYHTIKYNSLGDPVPGWDITYNGGSADYSQDVVVDASGNVYVTGRSVNSSTFKWDWRTIKYSPSSPVVELWSKTLSGGATDALAFGMTMDASRNIYVTGQYVPGSGSDFRTIEYSPTDEVYVVGTTQSSTIAGQIVKYDSAGTFLWTKQFTPSGFNGEARDVAVDSSGNFYVAGYTDVSGNRDFRTAKYDSAGNLVASWGSGGVATYDSGGFQEDEAYALAVDSQGNVYVTGRTWNSSDVLNPDKWDIITLKYDPTGIRVSSWDKKLVRPNGDYAMDIALDSSGDVYVAGYFCSDTLNRRCSATSEMDWQGRIVKYTSSSSGYAEVWNVTLPPSGNEDFLYGVAVDAEKNVYVTGRAGFAIRTVKYNNSPTLQWDTPFDSSLDDIAFGIALDASGTPYVTGYSGAAPMFDYRTIKYASSSGQIIRNILFDSGFNDEARAIAVDASGNIYVTGKRAPLTIPSSDITKDFMTIKYGNFPGLGPACSSPIAISWIDPTITGNQTKIRQIHVYELRAWVNNQRQDVGLGIQAWTDSTITANSTKVKAAHFTEMRTAINAVYTRCGQALPTYTDPTLTANSTKIKKAHIEELRSATVNAP